MDTIDRILKVKEENKLNNKQFEQTVGLPNGIIHHWVNKLQNPSAENLTKISKHFNLSVDYLLGRTDDPRPIGSVEPLLVPMLSPDQQELLGLYEKLDEYEKAMLKGYIEGFIEKREIFNQK
jgi:transcriptional regulator with XRE-family HTH domain